MFRKILLIVALALASSGAANAQTHDIIGDRVNITSNGNVEINLKDADDTLKITNGVQSTSPVTLTFGDEGLTCADLTLTDDLLLAGDLGSESAPMTALYATDIDVDDDLVVDDDATITGDLTVVGGGNLGSESAPLTTGFFTDLDVDDDLTVDDDFTLTGDLGSESAPSNAGYFTDLDVDDDLTVDDDTVLTDDVVIGAASDATGTVAALSVIGNADSQEQLNIVETGADTTGSRNRFFKTRATTSAPTTIVVAGDEVARFSFRGADGTDYDEGARITAKVATGVGAGTDMPMELVLSTSPDGSATVTDKLLLHSYNDLDLLGDFGLAGTTANGSDTGSFTFCPAGGISGGVGGGNCSGGRAAVLVISGADDTTADATAGSVDIRTSDTNGSKIKLRPNGATNIVEYTDADNGKMNWGHTCVTETIDSAAGTETITGVIPARAVSLGVSCRVDTILAGAGLTTWSLGDGVDADLYGTTLALAAGTTVGTSNYTASPMTQVWSTSAGNLTMTAAAGQFDSGVVTCCSHWFTHTGPAS